MQSGIPISGASRLALALVTGLFAGCGPSPDQPRDETDRGTQAVPARIVSLAPSITEIVFALDLGDRLVGVTKFCDYPPAASEIEKIGGYYDPNYERIYTLEPDVVIMLREHQEAAESCRTLGIGVLQVPNATLAEVIGSVETIGARCGVRKRGEELARRLRERLEEVRVEPTGHAERQKVLVSIGRTMGSDGVRDVSIAGRNTMYDELVEWTGGANAYQGKLSYPSIGREGLVRMAPDVIVDVVADLEQKGLTVAEVRRQWQSFQELEAVREGRIHVFGGDYAVIPGPRIVELAEDFANALHPGDAP